MKLSIVVPVYNVEPYLRRCIDSILAQTFTDFELILVDDGSPDNCPAICDEYAKKDPRIRVFHKENGGQSSARNLALDAMAMGCTLIEAGHYETENPVCEVLCNALQNAADAIEYKVTFFCSKDKPFGR